MMSDTSGVDPNAGLRAAIARETETLDQAEAYHAAPGSIRRPEQNPYIGNQAAIAERRQYLAEMKIRAGLLPEPTVTPEQHAEAAFEARWQQPTVPESISAMLDIERDRVKALNGLGREHARRDLVKIYGGEEAYGEMVRLAKASLAPGAKWDEANEYSQPILRLMASHGAHREARDREKATLDQTLAAYRR